MNRDEILRALSAVFGDFIVHDNLIGELARIIHGSGYEVKFFNLLMARLKFLSEHGSLAIQYPKGFESLAHKCEGLYSMRLIGENFNVRILYAFLPTGSPVLLLGFAERSGKRVSSYDAHTPVAKNRLNTMLEAYDHGE